MTIQNDFGIICVDNFYNDPDAIVEYANSCKYDILNTNYPGSRTAPLYEINPFLYDIFTKKIMSILFDLENTNINFSLDSRFHKIDKISNDKKVNMGGIHCDDSVIAFAGVIYLNKNYDLDCGTSIFQRHTMPPPELDTLEKKWNEYADMDKEEYRKFYTEIVKFQNVYNRMILYDTCYLHSINSLASDDTRLTQVFFCDSITSSSAPPRMRSKKYEY